MGKSITFEYEEKKYTLEFNRKSVERLERSGFVLDEISSKPLVMIPMLFHGAFYMHHKGHYAGVYKQDTGRHKRCKGSCRRSGRYVLEPVLSLIDDEVDEAKNVSWAVN